MMGTMTLDEFIAEHGISADYRKMPDTPDAPEKFDRTARHWRITLRLPDGRKMTTPYSCGSGWAEDERPPVSYVLGHFADSLRDLANYGPAGFESWARDMDQDTDSRKALATFNAILRKGRKVAKWLGPKLADVLASTEPA